MKENVVFTGEALRELQELLVKLGTDKVAYKLSFAIDEGGLKIKLDNYGWTPARGTLVTFPPAHGIVSPATGTAPEQP